MIKHYLYPPSDPDTAAVVDQLRSSLQTLADSWNDVRSALEQGITPGVLRGITPQEYAALYTMAHKLCDEGDFQNALVIGLQLVFHAPGNAKYAFLTGSCLHRTEQTEAAAAMYALALEIDDQHAAAAYRLGECLLALDKRPEARTMFEKSLDLSRSDFSRRELLLMAEQALNELS